MDHHTWITMIYVSGFSFWKEITVYSNNWLLFKFFNLCYSACFCFTKELTHWFCQQLVTILRQCSCSSTSHYLYSRKKLLFSLKRLLSSPQFWWWGPMSFLIWNSYSDRFYHWLIMRLVIKGIQTHSVCESIQVNPVSKIKRNFPTDSKTKTSAFCFYFTHTLLTAKSCRLQQVPMWPSWHQPPNETISLQPTSIRFWENVSHTHKWVVIGSFCLFSC